MSQWLTRQREGRCFLKFVLRLCVTGLLLVTVTGFLGDHRAVIKGQCAKCQAWSWCSKESDCKKKSCCYEFDPSTLVPLNLQVNCSEPHRSFIDGQRKPLNKSGPCSGLKLANTAEQKCLTALPSNLCDFPETRAVIIRGTALTEFPDVSCLKKLRFLDLRDNRLTSVPEHAFAGFTKLEEIRLDSNQIEFIDPNAFDENLQMLNRFTATYNQLHAMQPWPARIHHQFCIFDLSFNRIQHILFTLNGTFDPTKNYGPGFVDLSHNNISESPIKFAKEAGFFDQVQMWSKFFDWGIDLRENPFYCDCDFFEIALGLRFVTTVQRFDYFNIKCAGPPKYKGVLIMDLPVKELTCDITENCPQSCTCLRRPGKKDVLVDCSGSGLSELPPLLPPGNLTLDLSNNSLTSLAPREYLARTLHLNVSGNKVESIEEEVPRLLRPKVESFDLRNNLVHALPYTFQALSPDALYLDPNTLSCTCDLKWFPGWAQQSASPRYEEVFCIVGDGHQVLVRNATEGDLGCNLEEADTSVYKVSLISLAVVLVVGVAVTVGLRYELLVLTHVFRRRLRRRRPFCKGSLTAYSGTTPDYDVFLSTSSVSEADITWVNGELLPVLDKFHLTVFWPARDCEPGSVELDQVIKKLQDSASALVVLSEDFITSPACVFQFRQAYTRMVKQGQGRVILLQPGELTTKHITEPRLRAMVTLRMAHKNCTADRLRKIIGSLSTQFSPYNDEQW